MTAVYDTCQRLHFALARRQDGLIPILAARLHQDLDRRLESLRGVTKGPQRLLLTKLIETLSAHVTAELDRDQLMTVLITCEVVDLAVERPMTAAQLASYLDRLWLHRVDHVGPAHAWRAPELDYQDPCGGIWV